MFVLSRRSEESVVVGEGVNRLLKVTVLEVCHGSVWLGFETEDSTPVYRLEAMKKPDQLEPQPVPKDDPMPQVESPLHLVNAC